jgi:hypothetical protein
VSAKERCESRWSISRVKFPEIFKNNFVRPVSSFSVENERRFRCRRHLQGISVGEGSRGSPVTKRMQMKHFAFPFIERNSSPNFVHCSFIRPFQKNPPPQFLHPGESVREITDENDQKPTFLIGFDYLLKLWLSSQL